MVDDNYITYSTYSISNNDAKYLGEYKGAEKIEKALERVFLEGNKLTVDLGGNATTKEFTETVCEYIVSEEAILI